MMNQDRAIMRSLRERAPSEGFGTADALAAADQIAAVEVTAVNVGALPPTHDLVMLDYYGEQIEGSTISGAILPGGASAAVGSKLAVVQLASGHFLLLAGGGGSSGSSSGLVPPHSHMGGADGPPIGIVGTV